MKNRTAQKEISFPVDLPQTVERFRPIVEEIQLLREELYLSVTAFQYEILQIAQLPALQKLLQEEPTPFPEASAENQTKNKVVELFSELLTRQQWIQDNLNEFATLADIYLTVTFATYNDTIRDLPHQYEITDKSKMRQLARLIRNHLKHGNAILEQIRLR